MEDATVTTIGVTYAVHAYPGYDPADLIVRIDATLEDWLESVNWGRPREFGETITNRWLLENKVRRFKVLDLIGDVEGVDYVDTVTLSGSAGSADGSGNWDMPGTVALTTPGTMTGSTV